MKIAQIQRDIEEGLANLTVANLPPPLEGLRHLPVGDHHPQVIIRYVEGGRKVREDAAGSYLDPDHCEVVIRFIPVENPREGGRAGENVPDPGDTAVPFDLDKPLEQLLDELGEIEGTRPFVGLKWFRDQVLPACRHEWARDPGTLRSLLRYATDQRLILTGQVPNPNQPHHPVTAIRINRRHPLYQSEAPRRESRFTPVRIRGGSMADTVLGDRR
jgi:hypothetical protein